MCKGAASFFHTVGFFTEMGKERMGRREKSTKNGNWELCKFTFFHLTSMPQKRSSLTYENTCAYTEHLLLSAAFKHIFKLSKLNFSYMGFSTWDSDKCFGGCKIPLGKIHFLLSRTRPWGKLHNQSGYYQNLPAAKSAC